MDRLTDEEIESFARRMIEGGVRESTYLNPGEWQDYTDTVEIGTTNLVPLTDAQKDALSYGMGMFTEKLSEAGLATRFATPQGTLQLRYADTTTGRLVSAKDAYSRLAAVGASVPEQVYNPKTGSHEWKYSYQQSGTVF